MRFRVAGPPKAANAPVVARLLASLSLLSLGGCSLGQFWVLQPRGPVTETSFYSLIVDVAAMMLIIGPTTLLILWCIWRYRKVTGKGAYTPDWSHSLTVEIVSWGFPLAIVAFLSYLSYWGTFQVNPFGPGVMAHGRNPDNDRKPVDVDVVTTDWQWLFIYPDHHIAAANELVVPVHTPIRFRMTSATVSNDFYIPQLAGEIDVMPGMLTRQGLIANQPGVYEGIAGEFNGPGFSWMQFKTRVVSQAAFERWTGDVGRSPKHLDQAEFDRFATPTINRSGKAIYFSAVDDKLFGHVIQDVMMGKMYPTPPNMTEKKASQEPGRRQQDTVAGSSSP